MTEIAAPALALAGARERTAELAAELEERFPEDTTIHAVQLPRIRAALALQVGDPAATVSALTPTIPYERAYLDVLYMRGQAYLAAGDSEAAMREFQKILDLPGVWPTLWYHSLARLGAARSQALAGNAEEARHFYQDFFALWQDADQDIPILLEARAEYDALQ